MEQAYAYGLWLGPRIKITTYMHISLGYGGINESAKYYLANSKSEIDISSSSPNQHQTQMKPVLQIIWIDENYIIS